MDVVLLPPPALDIREREVAPLIATAHPLDPDAACKAHSELIDAEFLACTIRLEDGQIVVVLPRPGTIGDGCYAALSLHELGHALAALQGDDTSGHAGWTPIRVDCAPIPTAPSTDPTGDDTHAIRE